MQRNVCHLDKLWWLPGWKTDSRENFDAKLDVELKKPEWIIDGDYSRTLPERLKYADTVIFLQYSRWVCLAGALSRIFRMRGKVRIDMSEGCPERLDREFLRYIWNFNASEGPKLEAALRSFRGRIIRLKSRRETARFLASKECSPMITPSSEFARLNSLEEQFAWVREHPVRQPDMLEGNIKN